MGKVVKAVAVIGLAVAVAVAAPQIAGAFFVAGTMSATVATAAIGAVLSMATAAALKAFASQPNTTTAPGQQPSRGQPMECDGFKFRYPADPATCSMRPVDPSWWRNPKFYPWERLTTGASSGNCLVPVVPADARWLVIDRHALIERGDVFVFKPNDLRDYLRAAGLRASSGLVKRFIGVDEDRRVIVYETTNPPNRMETGLDRLCHAYRVRSWHRSWWQAWREVRRG